MSQKAATLKRPEWVKQAWLGLGDISKIKHGNPLIKRSQMDIANPGLLEVRLMRDPQYLSFACKVLLEITILPEQAVILEEMWNKPFPMYVASRGFGKATDINEPILTDKGWVKMGDIKIGHKVYGRDGFLHNILAIHPQGKKQVCRITLLDGRTLDCCENHLWLVKRNDGKELTIDTKSIIANYKYKPKENGGSVYRYRIPNCQPIQMKKQDLPIDPYLLGCLLGDGCLTTLTPKISSNDEFIIQQFREKLSDFEIKKDKTNNNYTIVDKNKEATIKLSKLGNKYRSKTNNRLTTKIKELGLNVNCYKKFIPDIYKNSSIEDRMELIRGLIDTDGCITKSGAIEFTNVCEQLVDDMIDILRSLGITCTKSIDKRAGQTMTLPQGTMFIRKPYFRVYINTSKPIAKLPRKLNYIKKITTNAENFVAIIKAEYIDKYVEMQCVTVDNTDHTYITKDYIVTHNSFMLALYATLKCIMYPGTKVVIVGSGFRQAKVIFEYMESIWRNAPILRDLCTTDSGPRRDVDRCIMKLNIANSAESWAMAIPLGDGTKIRGLRAHIIIADEFASIPPDIYETVVAGFASVSASPVSNVIEAAQRRELAKLGLWTADAEAKYSARQRNQAIISGTADFAFKPFAQYWKRYCDIIKSDGNEKILKEILNMDEVPEGFNYQDYSVIRIPYELIPEGFMDEKQVIRAKATINSGIYAMEYGAVFVEDSEGFYKRSLIESCVATPNKPIRLPSSDVWFDVSLHGNKNKSYVIGVDPASEADNFSIIVLELCSDHVRIVYCWSTNRTDFKRRLNVGLAKSQDFYGFCARKIRDLMKAFPTIAIAIDGQGGGVAIEEALHDPDKMEVGELPIWPIIEDDKEKDTDIKPGLHILHICQFANAVWTSQANHGMRKDFEDKVLIFPRFDPITLGLATEEDGIRKKLFEKQHPDKIFNLYDTLEDCVMEIEELKTELSTIVMTQTGTGVGARDRWDTPEIKLPNGKKGKLRKDRYSALVMANMVARQQKRADPLPEYNMIGDFAHNIISSKTDNSPTYTGPEWFTNGMKDILSIYH